MFPQKLSLQTSFIDLVSALVWVGALVAALNASAQPVTVVEYYNKTIDAHFITGRANEQTVLDGVADFQRTGMTFAATAVASAPASLTKICRFYISLTSPYVSSHFYGRQGIDCESIRALSPAGFSWEDYDFATQQPTAGACPAGTTTILRGFRAAASGKTSNHRYSASQANYDAAAAAGYVGEGAAFCVAAATAATNLNATAVGTANGTPVSASIGPSGGALTSADGKLTLSVPANALAGSVMLTILPITNEAPGGLGSSYRMLPDGQVFAAPVKLALRYDDPDLAGTLPELLDVGFQNAQRVWQVFKSAQLDKVNRQLTISTPHFTDYSKRAKLKLITPAPRIRVGDAERLTLNICETTDVGDDLSTLGAKGCAPERVDVIAAGWAVNGIPGGNSTVGTVSQTGSHAAVYAAPAKKPTPDVVAVSVQLGLGADKYLVVSNITIFDDSWLGTGKSVTCTADGCGSNGAAEVTWTLDKTVNNVASYVPSGTASLVGLPCSFAPSSVPIKSDDGLLTVNYNTNPATYQGYGSSAWDAVVTCQGGSVAGFAGAVFLGGSKGPGGAFAEGFVSGDGLTIEGSDTLLVPGASSTRFDWKFTRKP